MRIAQRLLLHLAHRIARQRLDEEHALGQLVARQAVLQRGEHRLLGQDRVRRRHDDRRHALAEIGMRQADDGAFGDAIERVDLRLDLDRIDVEAAGDDQVLGAADDMDIAALVDPGEIAGDEIAVGAKFLAPSFPASANSP